MRSDLEVGVECGYDQMGQTQGIRERRVSVIRSKLKFDASASLTHTPAGTVSATPALSLIHI